MIELVVLRDKLNSDSNKKKRIDSENNEILDYANNWFCLKHDFLIFIQRKGEKCEKKLCC